MLTLHEGQIKTEGENKLNSETSNNISITNTNNVSPLSPGTTSSFGSTKRPAGDQQKLVEVLQFLKDRNLIETAEKLCEETGLPEVDVSRGLKSLGPGGITGSAESEDVDANSLLAYGQQGESHLYEVYYSSLKRFIDESVLDCHRAELSQVYYPLFVHMYLELVYNNHENEAKAFFERFSVFQESYYEDVLRVLSGFSKKAHMQGNNTMLDFRTSQFVLRISRDSYQLLKRHLMECQNNQILKIVQEHLDIETFDGMPRSKAQIDAMSGSLAGEVKREANRAKVFYGLLKEPDVEPADEEDEEVDNEDGRPRRKKPKKDGMGSKGKKQDPNAPQLPKQISFPELKESDRVERKMAAREAAKRIRLGPGVLPSICFYSFLNAYQGLTAVDVADDSSLIAGGFADSTVRVWSVTPQKLRRVKSAADLCLIDKESENVLEMIMDENSASESKTLLGHSGPVFGVSFSPDKNYLLSGSEDSTIRLWSLQTFTCLVCYKGHNYPVWDARFSPHGYYFVSGGNDRVARLWASDHYQPLRMFAGHLADITCICFHPNSHYVVTGSADRTLRLWDVSTGNCVRTFTGHKGPIHALAFSPNGKFLASGSTDGRVILWDIPHGLMISELKGHMDTIYALAFSRDGEILASGSIDNTVRLWDAAKVFDNAETDDFTTGHVHLPDNSQELLLGTYMTKSTPVVHLHFTQRNLLLAVGAYNPPH